MRCTCNGSSLKVNSHIIINAFNETLTTLKLEYDKIGDAGAIGLGKVLTVNATLTELDLRYNKIGDTGAVGLGEGLKPRSTRR
jgi:hypothetical protein